jgi:hypothetical protein
MAGGSRSVKFTVKPKSYPMVKFHYRGQNENDNDLFETEVTFPQEFWLNLAGMCREVASSMGVFSSQKIMAGLNLMSQTILAEIEAESRRLKYKGEYESLADFVFEMSNRTDIDKVRIGQLIHEKANKLKLHP